MAEQPPFDLLTRIAVIEAKIRVIVLALEGVIVAAVSALLAYFFGK